MKDHNLNIKAEEIHQEMQKILDRLECLLILLEEREKRENKDFDRESFYEERR